MKLLAVSGKGQRFIRDCLDQAITSLFSPGDYFESYGSSFVDLFKVFAIFTIEMRRM
jgi:hypothetical protein